MEAEMRKPEHGINKNLASSSSSGLWYIACNFTFCRSTDDVLAAWGLIMSASSVRLPLGSWLLQAAGYLLGCTLLHNASCIWGDMCDVEFDKQGERTKVRPIACGLVSMTGAGILFLVHCLLCVLLLSFAGNAALWVGLLGLFFVDLPYPLSKRWTDWPQIWLGVATTWGLPVTWVSMTGFMDWNLIPVLFVAGVCWTIYYDTIYACQDRRDDVKSGVRSTAVLFGDNVRAMLAVVAAVFVLCLAYAGVLNGNGPMYFLITVVGTAAHLVWQLVTADFDCDADCWRMFARNSDIGYITVAGMLCDYCLRMNV
ncbi:4-hydroxybenzoate polyprenyltransferase, mitochondrial [Grifola frondosa]|uniref:4-hydroxybenzoate polyprenyltransferase, mitochondrial n=1 Tax=Grifola frondosa TaxID=5627 RepID=A0A1C7MH95_GRIFR|nr:4-hydroxybenzoate polyprenyltransferase, mitochondrial [Grifola frondosa]